MGKENLNNRTILRGGSSHREHGPSGKVTFRSGSSNSPTPNNCTLDERSQQAFDEYWKKRQDNTHWFWKLFTDRKELKEVWFKLGYLHGFVDDQEEMRKILSDIYEKRK